MRFGVLGPVMVWTPAGAVDVGGSRQRRLLAALLLRPGEAVSTERLIEIVFEGEPPSGASTTIRSYIARLRKALGDAEPGADQLISTDQGGYRLSIDAGAIDAARFEASIETARGQLEDRDPIAAAATLRTGLAMWCGDAYGEFTFEEWAHPEALRLEELKTVAEEALNEALLACGLANDVVSATRAQIDMHPLREKLRSQHMLALYRAGRQAEALRSLEEFQQILVDVGLEPSDDLLRLGRSIAAHDPALRLDSPAGQPLRGYRVGAALGHGAHGVVYRAVQPGVGREVAIKTIRAQLADDPEFIRRFDAEAQLVANLEHPHVVPIYDYWREPGGAYIVMRLLSDNLGERVAAGPMEVPAVATIARQLGSALATAHRAGVVHGDIKPSNVLVDQSSTYLADFGVASLVESAGGDGTMYPSSGYESPELLAGEQPTPASDQFALALLLVQLLTGHLPFGTRAIATPHDRTPSIHVQRPSVPTPVDAVLWKATAWDAADRYGDVETFIEHFEAALAGHIEPTRRDRELANPYRGLRAFTEADQGVFYGRNAVVDDLIERLRRDGTDGRIVVAIGASGSGKSSVVRAGLIPKLRTGAIPGSEQWLIATMTPGSDPFSELSGALRSVATSDPGERAADPDESEVLRVLDAAVPPTQPLLLVVDQLEELFTQVSDEATRRHFIDGLTRAISRPEANLRIVATLRADYLDRPLRYSAFGHLVKHGAVPIASMSAPEIEAAITRPAAGVGVEVEPALATQLVADVFDQPAALPLLQFTLTELFDRRTGPVLTLDSYHELGGVDAAVAGRAEQVFGRLTETEREHARRMFLRLVTVGESRSMSRRRARRSDLVSTADRPDEMENVLEAFGASRLLSFDRDPDTREPTVEVAHEALIDQWPRFGDWVADAGEGLRIQGQLTEASQTWDEQGRDDSHLYRGLRLEGALEWTAAQPETLSPLEREFLAVSTDVRTAEVETERAQAERDRRTNQRLRVLLAGVGLLLAIALAAGALAIRQQQRANSEAAAAREAAVEAERQTEIALVAETQAIRQQRRADDEAAAARGSAAEAERQTEIAVAAVENADLATLISRSAALSAEDAELSILLALEAHRRSPGPATEQAVLNALGSSPILNRIATFDGLDRGDCLTPIFYNRHGRSDSRAYAHANGRLTSLDLTTGQVTDHGPSDEECGVWLGDSASNRVVAGSAGMDRSWVGTFDDPYAIELEQPGPMGLVNTDLASNVAAFYSDQGTILYNATTGARIGEPIGEGELWGLSVDPSGSYVAVSNAIRDDNEGTGRLRVLDARTGAQLFQVPSTVPASSLTFDSDTLELIAGMADGGIMTVDLVTHEATSIVATTAAVIVREVGVRPDGLIVAVSDSQIELVDRRAGSTGEVFQLHNVVETRVRADGNVFTVRVDGARFEHDVIELDGNALVQRSWPVDPIVDVAIDDGQAALVNRASQDVSVVDLETGEATEFTLRDLQGNPFIVDAVFPEPDGLWAVTFSGVVSRWVGETLIERFDFPGQLVHQTRFGDALAVLGVAPEGDHLEVSLISLGREAASVLFTVPSPPDGFSVHPSMDGGLHVFGLHGTLHTYDAAGALTGEFETGAVGATPITMDRSTGLLAAAASASGEVVVIDPDAREVTQLPVNYTVANLGFAQDGRLLVITGIDGTIRIWDLDRGQAAGLVWDGTGVNAYRSPSWYDASSDSIWVATSGRLIEIPLDPQRWVERACEIVGRDLTTDEWIRYVPESIDVEEFGADRPGSGDLVPASACT